MEKEEGSALFEETKLRLNRWQWALFALVIVVSGLLGFATISSSTSSVNQAQFFAQGETRSASVIFSQRETLVFTTRLAQWASGAIARRDVQIARALLAQRLSVIDQSGTSVGAALPDSYLNSIKDGDALLASFGPGVLTPSEQKVAKVESAPIINSILENARSFVSTYQQALDDELIKTAQDRKNADRVSLILLFALLALISIFAGWVGFTTRTQYLRSRRAIRREILELGQIQRDLEAARENIAQLRTLNEAKNEFVSTVNHELRTPLTSIIGYSDLMMMEVEKKDDDQLKNLLIYIQRNATLLLELVESMLSLSKLDSGIEVSHNDEVNICDVIDGAIFVLELDAKNKNLDVTFTQPDIENCTVMGNEGQLSQVFINLISNAIKFSPENSSIEITIKKRSDSRMIEIYVTDHGIGIPAEDIPRLFNRFFRARNVTHSQLPGTGLGLEIVSRIVALHKGTVQVSSVENQGATFVVSLPKTLDPIEKLVAANRMGVLQRAIAFLEAAKPEELENVIHTLAGTLPFYTFEIEGAEAAAIENWCRTTEGYSKTEFHERAETLLGHLRKTLLTLNQPAEQPNDEVNHNV